MSKSKIAIDTQFETLDWQKPKEIVSSIRNNRISVGELNPQDLQKVCFLNERYKRITISDIEKTTNLLNILQGPAVEPRKKYIYENAKDLGFEFD